MWKWLRWGIFRNQWKEMSMGEFIDKLAIIKVKTKKIGGGPLERQAYEMEKRLQLYILDHLNDFDADYVNKWYAGLYHNHLKQWDYEDGVMAATDPVIGIEFAKKSREANLWRAILKKQIDETFGEKYLEVKKYAKLKELE